MKQKIIDFHTHAFPEKVADKAVSFLGDHYKMAIENDGRLKNLWESAQAANVDTIVVHASATTPKQVESINTWIGSKANGSSIIGFGSIHPDYDGDISEELNRIKTLGLKGLKLHPDFQKFNIDDPKMDRIYRELDGTLPVLFHLGDETLDYSSPRRLAKVLDRFPNIVAIGAHMGGYMRWDEAEEYLFGHNLYIDTSSCLHRMTNERFMTLIKKQGVKKVVFGTDYPIISHQAEIEKIMALPLTDTERNYILWENAAKILNLI
jgi:predicted TIM-barrel fold metal-dependent hydrolase